MENLANPETPIDVEVLNDACVKMQNGNSEACEVLRKFIEREDAWLAFDEVMHSDADIHTKFIMLTVINNLIKKRWDLLPEENQDDLRTYLFDLLLQLSKAEAPEYYQNQANNAFVSILLQDWPQKQSGFLEVLVQSALESNQHCILCLSIIKILCEYVFDQEENKLTTKRANEIIVALNNHAEMVFNLAIEIFNASNDAYITGYAFKIIKFFINWIKPDQIMTSGFFDIVSNFLMNEDLLVPVLATLSEIFDNVLLPEEFKPLIPSAFAHIVESIEQIIPPSIDFSVLDTSSIASVQVFSETLLVFLGKHPSLLEKPDFYQYIQISSQWLCCFCDVPDTDVLKSCCDFWKLNLSRYFRKTDPLNKEIRELYDESLPMLRRVLIKRMPRPEEIIIIEGEDGKIVREKQRGTIDQDLFSTIRQVLLALTKIDVDDTLNALVELLQQVQYSYSNEVYNSMCWSIGAISGSLNNETEKKFLSSFLIELLDLCNSTQEVDIRAIVASGFMYICAQYPRFISSNFVLFREIIFKLFDFMQQDVPGIKEMAVDTFNSIGKRARKVFCIEKPPEVEKPFIYDIAVELPKITQFLSPSLIVSFYEGVANISSGLLNPAMSEQVFNIVFAPLDNVFQSIAPSFSPFNSKANNDLLFVFNSYICIAEHLSKQFVYHFCNFYSQILDMYHNYINTFSNLLNEQYKNKSEFTEMRNIMISILNIFIKLASSYPDAISAQMVDDITNQVFSTFVESNHEARIPEVIQLASIMCEKDLILSKDDAFLVFDMLFVEITSMIGKDFESFPTIRLPSFRFIYVMINHYIGILLSITDYLDNVIGFINYGTQHPSMDICSLSLDIIGLFFKNTFELDPDMFIGILDKYFIQELQNTFEIVVDPTHKSCYNEIVSLLQYLFTIVPHGIGAEYISTHLIGLFSHRSPSEICGFVNNFISSKNDEKQFRDNVRDLLVTSQKFSPTDPELLKAEAEEIEQKAMELMKDVPGIEGPAMTDNDFLM